MSWTVTLLGVFALLLQCSAVTVATIDNVAVQWNSLLNSIICTKGVLFLDANTYYSQMHLAQWHALVALKNTGHCNSNLTEEAAVAYASRAVLNQYFTFETDSVLNPFLQTQLKALNLSSSQKKLAREIGEAVALRQVQSRVAGDPGREFILDAVTAALDKPNPAPGNYRYFTTPGALPSRFFNHLGLTKTYILPNPSAFRKLFLSRYHSPAVPSKEWDIQWNDLKDIGRVDWPGRTQEIDNIASFWNAGPTKGSLCTQPAFWDGALLALLPLETSLYDTIELYAKLHIAMHDGCVLGSFLQWTFWFWRPIVAFREGDPDHAPIANWTSWVPYNLHPEYPSITTTGIGAGAAVLEDYFKQKGLAVRPFTVQGANPGPPCDTSGSVVGPRQFASLAAAVEEAALGRQYAGHHFNVSAAHGAEIGQIAGEYVALHWTEPGGPSGVLPEAAYLNLLAKRPEKAGMASPIEFIV